MSFRTHHNAGLLLLALSAALATRPHIIFVMVDDFGYYDVGYHGNPEAATPNMDALVSDGIRLE